MKKEKYFEKIHEYLNGQMDDSGGKAFEKAMASDEELRHDVEFEKKLLAGMEMAGDAELKQTIKEVHERMQNKDFFKAEEKHTFRIVSFKNYSKMKKTLAIAASLALLVLVAWWIFSKGAASVDTKAAFAQYFKPETTIVKGIIANRPSAFADVDTLKDALILYDEGKYDDAVATLDTFLVYHPENDTAKFYLGMAHLNGSRYARAIEILAPLTQNSDFAMQNDAKWYLALCYLMVDDGIEKSKEIFTNLAEDPEYKDRQAAEGILRLLAAN